MRQSIPLLLCSNFDFSPATVYELCFTHNAFMDVCGFSDVYVQGSSSKNEPYTAIHLCSLAQELQFQEDNILFRTKIGSIKDFFVTNEDRHICEKGSKFCKCKECGDMDLFHPVGYVLTDIQKVRY